MPSGRTPPSRVFSSVLKNTLKFLLLLLKSPLLRVLNGSGVPRHPFPESRLRASFLPHPQHSAHPCHSYTTFSLCFSETRCYQAPELARKGLNTDRITQKNSKISLCVVPYFEKQIVRSEEESRLFFNSLSFDLYLLFNAFSLQTLAEQLPCAWL